MTFLGLLKLKVNKPNSPSLHLSHYSHHQNSGVFHVTLPVSSATAPVQHALSQTVYSAHETDIKQKHTSFWMMLYLKVTLTCIYQSENFSQAFLSTHTAWWHFHLQTAGCLIAVTELRFLCVVLWVTAKRTCVFYFIHWTSTGQINRLIKYCTPIQYLYEVWAKHVQYQWTVLVSWDFVHRLTTTLTSHSRVWDWD